MSGRRIPFGPSKTEREVLALFNGRRKRWTADAASEKLGRHVLRVRPVFSMLAAPLYRKGKMVRPAYLRLTEKVGGKTILGNPQHYYERLPQQRDFSEYWS